ncbi:MAG: helix-turn-helix domain-containing protein [Oscillospiraceae bacterium]
MKRRGRSVSVLLIWIISYLIVFSIPTATFFGVYQKMNDISEKEAQATRFAVLEKTKMHIDNALTQMDNLANEVSFKENIVHLAGVSEALSSQDRFMLLQVMKELSVYIDNYSIFSNCFLYLSAHDLVVSDANILPSMTFYHTYFEGDVGGYFEIMSLMEKNYQGTFLPVVSGGREYIAFLKTIPIQVKDKNPINLLLLLDKAMLQREVALTDSATYLVNRDGSFLFESTSDPQPKQQVLLEELTGESGVLTKGDDMLLYTESGHQNMYYVSVTSRGDFNQSVDGLRRLFLLSIAISGAVSLLLIFLFVRWNYVPLKRILTGGEGEGKGEKKSMLGVREYETLQTRIEGFRDSQVESEIVRTKYGQQRMQSYLNSLLLAGKDAPAVLQRIGEQFGDVLPREPVELLLCEVADWGEFAEDYSFDKADTASLVGFACGNILRDIVGEQLLCHTVNEEYIVLFFKSAPNVEEAARRLSEIMEQIFGTVLRCTVSGRGEAPEEIPALYAEAAARSKKDREERHSKAFSAGVAEYVHAHYSDPVLGNASVASALGYSAGYLSKRFKQEQGLNLSDYIATCRIEAAKELIEKTGMALEQVAQQVGYNNYRTFSRAFAAETGRSPREYRKTAE